LAKSDEISQRYHNNKKGEVVLRHSVFMFGVWHIINTLQESYNRRYLKQVFAMARVGLSTYFYEGYCCYLGYFHEGICRTWVDLVGT